MGRLLFLGLLIALIIYLVKRYIRNKISAGTAADQPVNLGTEDMVQCATCQVHIARSEAFLVQQHFYCCPAHTPKK
ncbi:MAG: hypothetical protein LAC66_05355 [Methylotenera sp.]|nr:hypothetical protein [Methylotenera sp.]